MPPLKKSIAARIAALPALHTNSNPLWQGPCGMGPLGGITQSMLVRFLSCRERFRLKYVLGLEPPDRWNHKIGYGNMWHVCEEAWATGQGGNCWYGPIAQYSAQQMARFPLQRDDINKWYNVCKVQFPEYVRYWSEHPDVLNRKPLMQEQVFDVPYQLPSGRTVRLRGKWDSVDLIDGGIYLQENKTKGDIDKMQVERQLRFDLQTMMYLVALHTDGNHKYVIDEHPKKDIRSDWSILGVRYNVVRRPLSGGVGNIKPHAARFTKNTAKPAETDEEFYERLRRDYISADPDYWFFRVRAEISAKDIQVFRETCLDPLLENMCCWYNTITLKQYDPIPPHCLHYRTPFGVYSALEEGGATEYDAYLSTGSEAGLRRVETLFTELQ